MDIFLYRKLGFLTLVAFTIFFICWSVLTLPPVPPTMKRKVNMLTQSRPVLPVPESIYIRNGKSLLEYVADPFEKHYFDADVSDRLPSNRDIPDTRPFSCREKEYTLDAFKNTSVIITFHNEARSALLRTITSVINRTPSDLLQEIILIDDFSVDESDGQSLTKIPKIKLYRNKKREGLIRSRNIGASYASGEYFLFLDSHCEVNIGWLEPLLDRLSFHPGTLVSPIIDIIDAANFDYKASSGKLKAGFDWSLHFKWIPISEEEWEARDDETASYITPIIYGGIFIISKDWFHQLGEFNSDLEIWGGEALEISLKAWLCGGQVEVAPCSRIGHVFRRKHPYDFPNGSSDTFLRNTKIIAEAWLDDYKHFFYMERPNAKSIDINPSLKQWEVMKEKLQCRKFSWYLQNVFKELKLPNEEHVAFGELKHGSRCLEVVKSPNVVFLNDCFDNEGTKWALHNLTGVLSTESGGCLNVQKNHVIIEYCKSNFSQKWHRKGENLVHTKTGKCLENLFGNTVAVSPCRRGALSQFWSFSVEIQQLKL